MLYTIRLSSDTTRISHFAKIFFPDDNPKSYIFELGNTKENQGLLGGEYFTIMQIMNELGNEGWELVDSRSCWDDIDIFQGTSEYWFERRIIDH